MIGKTNAVSKPGVALSLVVSVTSGATVTATKGTETVTGTAASGSCTLNIPEAGTWSVVATLNGQTSDTKNVSVVDSYAVALSFFSATITVNVSSGASVVLTKGTTTQTKTSTGTAVFTVTETGTYTVAATLNGQTVNGSVTVTSGTTAYSLTLNFVSSTLNDNDWSVISDVSDEGTGANYWSIGDRKAVALSGTVGSMTFSGTYYAFIIGFNHNSAKEGSNRIHFQFAKTALSGGSDICFTDSYYNSTGGGFRMNTTNTNSGGWESSNMRTALCGTSLSSYSGTFIGVLPAALRAALKSVTKYTNNTGNSTAASAVTATTDYIFLLAEYEVFGATTYANSTEASYQAQYAYYSAGNSKIKYQHASTSTAARWWLRSPYASGSSTFVFVSAGGTVNGYNAYYSDGFAPGFCV
jgi:hypothetical protein